jgi:RNA polymerase sigma factor (sigma-70 family)
MAQRRNSPVLRFLNKLFEDRTIAGLNDRQLLKRFAANRDEDAFTLLVRRHGGMVLGVCGRVLADPSDVEDAFQATFLVLARKSSSFGWRDSIGNWLYGVALRVAKKMLLQRRRQSLTSVAVIEMPARLLAQADPSVAACQRELSEKLDEALQHIPAEFRAPLVLCYLEGKSHQEAARALGMPTGSMSRHLARGLELLRERLAQRHLLLSTDALAGLLARGVWRAIVDRSLAEATTQAALVFKLGTMTATGAASIRTLTLAHGVLRAMMLTQVKLFVGVVLAIGVLGAGGVLHERRLGGNGGGNELAGQEVPQVEGGAPAAQANPDEQELLPFTSHAEKLRKHHLMQIKLEKPVVLEKGLDKMTFGDAKQYIADRFDLTILANSRAFGEANILESQVQLEKMSAVSLREVLQLLADQLGATFVVRPGYVEFTKPEFVQPEAWIIGDRTFVPHVNANFQDVALDKALHELAMETGISVVLDQSAFHDANEPSVTAFFDGASLDTAVEILANMCGFKSVAMDRALYVTTIEKADSLIEIQTERRLAREKAEEKKRKEEEDKKKAAAKETGKKSAN